MERAVSENVKKEEWSLKIVYMGTPDFAVAPLEVLAESGHEIGYVLTQPDKARDRGKKVQYTPVKAKALELGLEVLQPEKVKGNTELFETLSAYAPDLIVVAAYGKILPPEIIHLPRLSCVNIHASLLPRFRGAAPIQRVIMAGDEFTGVTLMKMDEGLDTGDMIAASEVFIGAMTGGELHDELSRLGAELLREILPDIERALENALPQDDEKATYAPMIFKQDGVVDFSRTAEEIERQIRALDPWPGAFTSYNGDTMKLWGALPLDKPSEAAYGTVCAVSAEGIEVACGGGTLLVTEIQVPGKRRMAVGDFLRGNKIEKGVVLG